LGGTAFTDGPDPVALSGAGVASGLSGAFGKFAPIGVDKIIDDNSVPGLAYDIIGAGGFEFINGFVKDGLNSLPKDEKGNEK
jgi:filamentous hemagglutinin